LPKLTIDKKEFLKILEKKACNLSAACKAANISKQTFYNWCKNEKYLQLVEEVKESLIDFVEAKLLENVNDNKEASIFFFLKTKAKHRGYVERVENKNEISGALSVTPITGMIIK
jgi:Fe-S cluster biosynthesis and repair protein YggX